MIIYRKYFVTNAREKSDGKSHKTIEVGVRIILCYTRNHNYTVTFVSGTRLLFSEGCYYSKEYRSFLRYSSISLLEHCRVKAREY